MNPSKYNAIKSEYDGMVWDSKFELGVYKELKYITTSQDSGMRLAVKPGIVIKPKGLVFKERIWKCDFRVSSNSNFVNLEVKGFSTREFSLTLEMLESFAPAEFERTYLITNNDEVVKKYKGMESRIMHVADINYSLDNLLKCLLLKK